jgi:lipopolysaccharide export system protein LptA
MKSFLFAAALSAAAFARPAAASTTLPETRERNAPLIMENAERFEGSRSRGEYILTGKVRFRHGQMLMETERAVWMKDRNIVSCESGMRITRNGSLLTADRGTYDKNMGQATAQGNVYMRDSSGENQATGQNIVYLRFRHLATLTGNPEVRRYYVKKDSTADSAKTKAKVANAKAAPADTAKADGPDTLSIKGDIMTYDDSLQVAIADGNVRIHRDKLNITCKKAEYHDASDSLYLLGQPQVVVDDNQVKGEIMRMGMHGEEIKSLLVKGSAQAHSTEPATDTSAARQSDVRGDSLFLAFKEKAIDSVEVFKNANGAYFDVDKPEFVNKMSGDYMVLRFNGKQVSSANVLGGSGAAKSTYYHFEKRKLKGKNDAEGDTLDFAFKDGKIEEVMVKGSAKGTYFGEKDKGGGANDSASAPPADSARAARPKPATAPVAPAVKAAVPAAGKPAPAAGRPAPAENKNAAPGKAPGEEAPLRKPIWRSK